jgi:hypothetical protein
MVLSRKAVADFNRYVWWARKPTDASSYGQGNDPVHDEEDLESDEEDRGHHATNITNVPLPSATDATQASVEQLAALAVSTDEQEREKPAASMPESKSGAPTLCDEKVPPVTPPSIFKKAEEHVLSHSDRQPDISIPSSTTEDGKDQPPLTTASRPKEQHKTSSPQR